MDHPSPQDNILRRPRVTVADIRKYERELKQLQAKADSVTGETRKRIQAIVAKHRAEINDLLVEWGPSDGPFPAARAPGVSRAVKAKVDVMLKELTTELQDGTRGAWDLGYKAGQGASKAFADIGVGFFSPNADLLAVALNHNADLIRTIEAELIPQVDLVISRGVLGSLTPFQVMQGIDELIGRGGNGGVSYQAERIVRTETARIYRVALDDQIQRFAGLLEGGGKKLKKKWVSGPWRPGRRETHQAMDGVVVDLDEPFVLPDGVRLMYPGALGPDNSPENTINCGCTYILDREAMEEAALAAIDNL